EPQRRRHRARSQGGAVHRHEDRLRRARPAVAARLPGVRGAGCARLPGAEGRPLVLPRAPGADLDVPRAVVHQRGLGRGHLRDALPGVGGGEPQRPRIVLPFEPPRSRRLRAPLLVTLWGLLGIEAAGGLFIFFMRLVAGRLPGEALHVIAGAALTLVYAVYQWQHWTRVSPWRGRLDYALGLIGGIAMASCLATGYVLAWPWWLARVVGRAPGAVRYSQLANAAHTIMSMLVLTFVLSHLA